MSYCRWSDDDYRCDVYCYHSAQGYVIMVAKNRHVPVEPLPPALTEGGVWDVDAWARRSAQVTEIIKRSPTVRIGKPYDGREFVCDTPHGCAQRLAELKKYGYNVPDWAIRELLLESILEAD